MIQTNNPEMHVDLMFPSIYLKAAELNGKEFVLTIKDVTVDVLMTVKGKTDPKYILTFAETVKMFVLNKTNARAIAKALNEPRAVKWPGHKITLYPATCEAFGETTDCIRVKGAK